MTPCALCSQTDRPQDDEDAYPLWLSDFERSLSGHLGTRLSLNGMPISGYQLRHRRLVAVCMECNDWMNEWVEQPARTLIKRLVAGAREGNPLTRAQQMRIAVWLYKTAAMLSAAEEAPFPRYEVTNFYHQGVPAPTVTIWIGHMEEDWGRPSAPQHLDPKSAPIPHTVVPGRWGTTGIFHRLCWDVLSQPSATYRAVTSPIESDGRLVRIWPARETMIDWPPPVVIDRPTYETLGTMWQDGIEWPT